MIPYRDRHTGLKTLTMVFLSSLLLFAANTWAGPVEDQVRDTLEQLIDVLNDPTLKGPEKKGQRDERLHCILKERFDEEAIARKTLGDHWGKITLEEQQEFVQLFSSLLERTYFQKIDDQLKETEGFSGKDILYLKEKVNGKGNAAQLTTAIKTGDGSENIPVIYRLRQVKGNWMVIDMKIEGVIITKNYRAQFRETLSRNPMSTLLEKLRAQLAPK